MTNAIYGLGREAFLSGLMDFTGSTGTQEFWIALIDTADYTVDIDVDQYFNTDTVSAASNVAMSGDLASKTVALGVADAADMVLTSVTGDECEAVIVFMENGGSGISASGTDDLLMAYYDSFASGMPVTPNSGDITIAWHGSGMFKL